MNKKIKIKIISTIILSFLLILLLNTKIFAATVTKLYMKDRNYNIYTATYNMDIFADDANEEDAKITSITCEVYVTQTIQTYQYIESGTEPHWHINGDYPSTVLYPNIRNGDPRNGLESGEWSTTKPTVPTPPSSETLRERDKNVDLEKVINSGDNFLNIGNKEQIPEEAIQNLSDTIYSTTLTIGIIIAIIVGAYLGVKFIISGMEGKAEVKQILLPYGIGVVVLFGAFTIWKIVLTILQN